MKYTMKIFLLFSFIIASFKPIYILFFWSIYSEEVFNEPLFYGAVFAFIFIVILLLRFLRKDKWVLYSFSHVGYVIIFVNLIRYFAYDLVYLYSGAIYIVLGFILLGIMTYEKMKTSN